MDTQSNSWDTDHLKQLVDARLDALSRAVLDGDERLREHVSSQEKQVRDALNAAEKLAIAEQARVEERIKGVELVASLTQKSAEKAVQKAEEAVEKRLEGQNEWRAQSADRERSQQETIARLTATLLPREVYDTTVAGWQQWREAVDKDRALLQGITEGRAKSQASLFALIGAVGGVLGIIIVLTSVLTR